MAQTQLALLVPDELTRRGIEGLIQANASTHYQVIVFEDFQALLRQGSTIDLLLMDISGVRLDAVESRLQRLAECCLDARVIVISSQLKVLHIKRIMQLGARGFIYRDDLSETLVTSIDLVARDMFTLSPQARQLLTNSNQLYVVNDLKPLDLQVLRLLASGLTVQAAAVELGISSRSAYRSRDKLREILGVQNIETLIDAAREQGLLDTE